MSTETAVHELVGITTACHTCIAGLVCVSLDMCETASCIRCVCVQAASEVLLVTDAGRPYSTALQ